MGRALTEKQRRVLEYIAQYREANGRSPTLAEIGAAVGNISPVAALAHVEALEQKGYLRRRAGRRRGLELGQREPEESGSPAIYRLPVLGEIAAGVPIEAYEDRSEALLVEAGIARSPSSYVLRVRGHSMIGDGILDGDYVIIQPQSVAENGDTVVALLEGNVATLKRFYREENRVRLQPANPYLEPIFAREVTIQGKVVAVVRVYS